MRATLAAIARLAAPAAVAVLGLAAVAGAAGARDALPSYVVPNLVAAGMALAVLAIACKPTKNT